MVSLLRSWVKSGRRRFGVLAPRMVVRRHVSWWSVVLMFAVVSVLTFTGGWYFACIDLNGSSDQNADLLRHRLVLQEEELASLRAAAGTRQNAVSMEKAAQQQLLSRLKVLESENAALKEDVLLFERLVPSIGAAPAVRVENFRAVADSGGGYRYRLLLVYQPEKQGAEFRGRLQLLASFRLAGGERRLLLPGEAALAEVTVRHILRREGVISLPAGAVLTGLEARLYQGDKLKSQSMAQL